MQRVLKAMLLMPEAAPCWLLSGWGWGAGIWQIGKCAEPDWQSASQQRLRCQVLQLTEATLELQLQRITADWTSPVHLVGWSAGGIVALRLAHDFPEKVLSLSLLACNPCFYTDVHWPGVAQCQGQQLQTGLQQHPVRQMQAFLRLQCEGEAQWRHLYSTLKSLPDGLLSAAAYPLAAQLQWLQSDYRDELRRVAAASCRKINVILGAEDQLVPQALAEYYRALNCHVRVWPATGHLIPWHFTRLWDALLPSILGMEY